MSRLSPNIIFVEEAEHVLRATIERGESLLLNGVEHISEVMSWLNLAHLSLEYVPACQSSFDTLCLAEYGSNRQLVEIGLSILRDASKKVHSPVYFSLSPPSDPYQALVRYYANEGTVSDGLYVS